MADNADTNPSESGAAAGVSAAPRPRLRLPLKTADDVRRELGRLYREGKAGHRHVSDVSKLANVLQILGRLIETTDLEKRVEALETAKDRSAQR